MRDWNKPDERREAVRLFVDYLHKPENKSKRDRCKKKGESAYAKQLFAEVGQIEGIPDTVEFHVYEKIEIEPRDSEYAMFVLPDPNQPIPWVDPSDKRKDTVDVSEIYRCTWDPWAA